MKFKEIDDIAMFEETDSELAKYMIGKSIEANKELRKRIDKAIEYIGLNEEDLKLYDIYDVNGIELYKILRGKE